MFEKSFFKREKQILSGQTTAERGENFFSGVLGICLATPFWRSVTGGGGVVGPRTLIHRPLCLVPSHYVPKQATLATPCTNNNA